VGIKRGGREESRVELMSPAGSLEGARRAFDAGADVVYAGVTNLSMRPKRVEFQGGGLDELTALAHERGKKVYAVLNVCPKPSDLPVFAERIEEIHRLKVDGAIVSDISVMEHIRDNYPDLPIHASIMTSVVNAEAAEFYKERGASVVVVSRSLGDLAEIRRIREQVDVDLEVFVHGGICYMYDGDCYMSSYWRQRWDFDPDLGAHRLMGQNNTKGECQLICKRNCSLRLEDEQLAEGRLMRRPDDVGLDRLPFYIDIGIKILKIEGRAMSLDYVSDATRLYRQAIDLYLEDPERYHVMEEWSPAIDRLIQARLDYERDWHIG
jgi:U32 family peptidase